MKLRTKFQDEDFKFGEVVDASFYHGANRIRVYVIAHNIIYDYYYNSIKDFTDHWEDAPEEPKGWCVTMYGGISRITKDDETLIPDLKEIGNYFNDKESAYDALDKLKAFKRLKDKGFRFDGYDVAHKSNGDLAGQIFYDAGNYSIADVEKEMDLIFGGEE